MSPTMDIAHTAVLWIAGLLMLWAAASDAKRFRIPNAACLAIILLFPLYGLTSAIPIPWADHLAVFAIVLGIGYLLYLQKWAGAGDIKLVAAIALWAGSAFVGTFLFTTALAGGILSLGIGVTTIVRQRLSGSTGPSELRKTPVPYGIAIAVGGLCVLALLSHPTLLSGG